MTGRRLVVPRGARSEVWKYFGFEADEFGNISSNDKRYVFCRLCDTKLIFSGNTTNLSSHMGRCQKRSLRERCYQGTSQASSKAAGNVFEDLQDNSTDFLDAITSMNDQSSSLDQEVHCPAAEDEQNVTTLDVPEGNQEYCLKWKHHQTNQQNMLFQLLKTERFCDVLIVCEEKFLKAHKLVLSTCSSYFENVLSHFEDRNPVVILRDVKYDDMAALIQFMYKGEINIEQDQLSSLLEAAEFLKVKGLSDICAEGRKLYNTDTPADNMDTETTVEQDSGPSWSGRQSKRSISKDEGHRPVKLQHSGSQTATPAKKPERARRHIEGVVQLSTYLKAKGTYEEYWKEPWVVQAMKDVTKRNMTIKDCSDLLGVSYSIMYTHYRQMKDSEPQIYRIQPTTVCQEGGEITLKCNEIAAVPPDANRPDQDIDPSVFVKVESMDSYPL